MNSQTKEYGCNTWSECQWNEYCSPTDQTSSPTISPTCKADPGGFGARGGALCKVAPSFTYPTGQCGWTQFCVNNAQDENDVSHTGYTSTTCQVPYSLPEGAQCPPDIGIQQLYIGDTSTTANYQNGNPISFCSSGPCTRSGTGITGQPIHRCSSADYTYAGTGCRQAAECGRGLTCGCPNRGGGRARCMPDGPHQTWENGRQEWFQILQPWFSCLENNQCTLNNFQVGSCGRKHCANVAQLNPSTRCTTDDPSESDIPDYKGYAATIAASSHLLPSFLVISVLGFISLMI